MVHYVTTFYPMTFALSLSFTHLCEYMLSTIYFSSGSHGSQALCDNMRELSATEPKNLPTVAADPAINSKWGWSENFQNELGSNHGSPPPVAKSENFQNDWTILDMNGDFYCIEAHLRGIYHSLSKEAPWGMGRHGLYKNK